MKPKIITHKQLNLVGFSFFGDPFEFSVGWTEENEIGQLWRRLMAYLVKHAGCIRHVKSHTVMVEVHISEPPLRLNYIYHTWLPKSGRRLSYAWAVEHTPHRSWKPKGERRK